MATNNFSFLELSGSNRAGYNSINALITDIDNKLYAKVAAPGMISILNTSITSAATMAANGWTDLGQSPAGLPALTGSYTYIQKATT
jgi:hypothetical protein